jgi:bacterioferritin-associated ferredoxin
LRGFDLGGPDRTVETTIHVHGVTNAEICRAIRDHAIEELATKVVQWIADEVAKEILAKPLTTRQRITRAITNWAREVRRKIGETIEIWRG